MKALDATLIAAKNQLYGVDPWIRLLILDLDGTTTLRWAIYPTDVVFDGNTYTAIPAAVENHTETNQGRIEGFTVHVANADRAVSAYLESTQLLGRNVTVRIVHAASLAVAAAKLDFTYRIEQVTITDQVATFTLGRQNLMALRLPRQRYIRSRCRHQFRDDYCGYPGDEFGPCTKQSFADSQSGGPFEKLNGWWVDHASNGAADISVSTSGSLTIANVNAGPYGWIDATHSGTFVFKDIVGDFDAEIYLEHASIATVNVGILFLAASADSANWVGFRWRCTTGPTQQLARISTAAGTSTVTAIVSWQQYARLVRAGSSVTWYTKAAAADAWTTQGTATLAGLPTALRVGFATHSDAAATVTALRFGYIRFTTGGLTTCDQTFDGANGCRLHKNTLRYGGAPAISRGRIM